MKCLKYPNLPDSRVVIAAISATATKEIKKLEEMNINCLKIKKDPRLPFQINSHADINMLHVSEKTILSLNKQLFDSKLNDYYKIEKINDQIGNQYPNDVRLNCTIIGKNIICNTKYVSKKVLEFAYLNDYNIIDVKQGYARCSVCILNKNAIITDDISIFSAAQNYINDITYISKGSIKLNGYNYGFIGGCCGKIDKNVIAVNGRIESHENHNKIIDSLERNKISCIELTENTLCDIGGILPLMQE